LKKGPNYWRRTGVGFPSTKGETKEIGKDTDILQSNMNKERNKRDRQRYRYSTIKYE
jgi:hypothetical protein